MKYIDTHIDLANACEHWNTCDRIALDSEFMRVDTFYPKLALIQINDGSETYLVDPVRINRAHRGEPREEVWAPLIEVLSNQGVVKVLHSPSEDFDAFYSNLGVVPSPIIDTQWAAAMASLDGIMGYQKLVKQLLDIDLEKGATRSDWLQRPLTDEQIHYAADDVEHLLEITKRLETQLVTQGRWTWLLEDCESMVEDWLIGQEQGYGIERIKKAWMLKPKQLFTLEKLLAWRERRCRTVNKPRGHILNDSLLVDLAMRLPTSTKQLSSIKGIRQPTVRKDGEQIVDIIQRCKESESSQWPERLPKPFNQVAGEWFKDMRDLVQKKAKELEVPPEMVARKKSLEEMLRKAYPHGPIEIPRSLQGWREEVIATPLVEKLRALVN